MTDTAGPFDGTPWAEAQWYRHAPMWAPSGVYGTPGTSSTTGDLPLSVSGRSVGLGAGRANVRGAGFERSGAAVLADPGANTHASFSRRDRIVLRRNLATHTVTQVIIQGTPASSPVAPALTQSETGSWDLPMFSFLVPPNSGASISGIVDERVWVSPDGQVVIPIPLAPADSGWVGEVDTAGSYGSPMARLTPSGEVKLSGLMRRTAVATSSGAGPGQYYPFTDVLPAALRPAGGQGRTLGYASTGSGPAEIYLLPTGTDAYKLLFSFPVQTQVYQSPGWYVNLTGLSYFL